MKSETEMALDQILLAYAKGERSGHIEWEDLNEAFEYANAACPGRYEELMEKLNNEN